MTLTPATSFVSKAPASAGADASATILYDLDPAERLITVQHIARRTTTTYRRR
jgi:hypothetical protein